MKRVIHPDIKLVSWHKLDCAGYIKMLYYGRIDLSEGKRLIQVSQISQKNA